MRASGLQGDSPPEIIEIFDGDTEGFDNRAQSHTIQDSGPRWIGPVALVALTAVIAYGVATSASSSGAPRVAIAPSTTGPGTTLPTPTTSTTLPPAPALPYYAAAPPRQFKIQYADVQPDTQVNRRDGGYQLWATRASISTPRSWFSISSFSGGPGPIAPNSYRMQTERGVFAISHMPSGQSSAQWMLNSDWVRIVAFGWKDADLVRLAESVTIDSGTGTVFFGNPPIVSGYELLSNIDPWAAVQGQPPEQVFYTAANDPFGGFGISVAPLRRAANGDFTLDRQTALQFLIDDVSPFQVDGNDAVAGTLIDQHDYALASWTAGDYLITLTGKMSVPDLIAIAGTVHQVTAAEWDGMKFQAIHNSTENNTNNNTAVDEPPPVPVSFGTDGQGNTWTIRAGLGTYGNAKQINWLWDSDGTSTTPDGTAQINTFVDKNRAYVFADLPRSIAATAELHVTPAGLDPRVIPFNDIDPNADRTLAAYVFSESGPYTAQVVGTDGTVLASWPSS